MVWTPEPTYPKPDISLRATTLYYQIVAPIMLPFLDKRLLNLFRCREGQCFFQRNREHPPTGSELDKLVHFEPVEQKNGRTEDYLYVTSTDEIVACARVQSVEFHGWGSRAGAVETPDRLVIDLDPDPKLGFDTVKQAAFDVHRGMESVGLDPDDPTAVRSAVETAGAEADEQMLRYLLRRTQRRRALWATLLDRPARPR